MVDFPIKDEIINPIRSKMSLKSLGYATIREIVQLVNKLEEQTGIRFIRTEMGVPGLSAPKTGTDAEKEALNKGVASVYPPIEGIKELKNELSRFSKLFLNIDISPEGCIPTVGSMQASMAVFLVANRRIKEKDTTLFIDPGFPVHKMQHRVTGLPYQSFDIYNHRGQKLRKKLESYLKQGNISTFLYSNPNNPSWICFTETELRIIGELASEYNVVVMEDLAYFGMDFRENYGIPGVAPYQPSVANYTGNYVLLFSGSKSFSYAGQRIGAILISDQLFEAKFPDLTSNFSTIEFGTAIIQEAIYTLSAGTAHSAQYGFAAMLRAVNEGTFNFIDSIKEYGDRAKMMKEAFLENGFRIVYDKDEDKLLGDGFYFTIAYNDYSGEKLLSELIRYGVSAITLDTTGSERTEGLRICVSRTNKEDIPALKERLQLFRKHHK
ncbi:MAG: pyridoxal phosphate-dependent aminotransferase [Bacteroidales bacterium]|nr:pyridoxal phosphate-dependent aminotransferase [Bacteroidales bacterium]